MKFTGRKDFRDIKNSAAYPGKKPETVLVDNDALNTRDVVYNYRIVAYDKNGVMVDILDGVLGAAGVEAATQTDRTHWSADVPWSNRTSQYPLHRIYRGPAHSTETDMVLIDMVNVNEQSFHYVDSGQYQSTPLKEPICIVPGRDAGSVWEPGDPGAAGEFFRDHLCPAQ